nr:trehalose-6-phosphate synthase [candidate division Zixibacteria bacterium]
MSRNTKLNHLRPIIVSNRLPVKVDEVNGVRKVLPGTGGLITALAPVLKNNAGVWVGWPGAPVTQELRQLLTDSTPDLGFDLDIVDLSETEVQGYYRGFSNESIWPLFHDLLDHCNFDAGHWETYQRVNYKFAAAAAFITGDDDFIWVQDYHLMMVGHFLKEMGFRDRSAFFLHIPFPPKDIFIRLPWRREIIDALLSYRLLGFQIERDRRNFIQCVRYLKPKAAVSHHTRYPYIKHGNSLTRIGSFSISIDFSYFNQAARSKEVSDAAWYIHERFPRQKIMLGIDRLDYTKGITHRLLAFENCLERYPELIEKITLVQIVVPSRTGVPEYQYMKSQIDEMVGRINSRFTRRGWVPIHYIYNTLDQVELIGYYRASEIALITPLKDGMNLVAKEYCASCVDDIGVLILSEFAGAASSLGCGAILVNPYHLEETADAIKTAYHMNEDQQRERMRKMRASVAKNDVFRWVDQFVNSFHFGDEKKRDQNKAETAFSGMFDR